MQNSGLILSSTPNNEAIYDANTTTNQHWHRSMVIRFWLCIVAMIVLYALWTAL